MRRPRTLKAAKDRAWKAISLYVRTTAADFNGYVDCVTCGKSLHYKEANAGHFKHGLTYSRDEDGKVFVWIENLHCQCVKCNLHRSGRLDMYSLFMLDTYGRELVDELELAKKQSKARVLKIKLDEYWEIEKEYRGQTHEF